MGAEDVAGHQVGGELDPLEVETQEPAEGLDEGGLADAGDAFEQDVPAAEDADEHEPVQVGPAQEHGVELFEQPAGEGGRRPQLVRVEEGVGHAVLI